MLQGRLGMVAKIRGTGLHRVVACFARRISVGSITQVLHQFSVLSSVGRASLLHGECQRFDPFSTDQLAFWSEFL